MFKICFEVPPIHIDVHLHSDQPAGSGELQAAMVELAESFFNFKGAVMATQSELKVDLDAVTAAVSRIGTESTATLAKVTELEAALAAGGATTPEVDAAMAALKAQVQVVDDLVVDAAAPTP